MNRTALPLSALLLGSTALAQHVPELASLDDPNQIVWQQTLNHDVTGALRWVEQPGERTLLLVHTTVDADVAGQSQADGVKALLTFMPSPEDEGWTHSASELQAAAATWDFTYEGEDPVIPPARVAAHLDAFASSGYAAGFGTHNTTTANVLRHAAQGVVATPNNAYDERMAWVDPGWFVESTTSLPGFDTAALGRAALLQQAYFHESQGGPTIDADALDDFDALMNEKFGYDIYIQPISVLLPDDETGRPRIRFRRHTRVRRVSLYGNGLDFGSVWLPNLSNATERIYLTPRGGNLYVEFPNAVSSASRPTPLRAYFRVVGGGYVMVSQTANPIIGGQVALPEVAIFAVPSDVVWSVTLFDDEQNPTVPIVPVGACGSGARVFPYAAGN